MEENITMKKLTVLLAMTMLLAACGGNSEPEKGNGESAKDKNGDYATAEITVQGDDVVAINLDETKEENPKRAWRQIWNEGRKQESEKGMG